MSYSQFIMAVFAIYVVYYAANILYDDAFLKQKKGKTNTGEEEEIISIGEEEEIPHKVVDEDFETGSYEKEDEKKKKESEQNYVSVNESIEMEVETQGIPMEQLLAKGKSMFSHVNFNK
jgi:hypothetical protein